MQIVINISKDDFEEICMQARMVEDTGSLFGRIRKAIFHGTPISSHGRLIDADALKEKMLNTEIEIGDDKTLWGRAVSVALDRYAPTVIGANKSNIV